MNETQFLTFFQLASNFDLEAFESVVSIVSCDFCDFNVSRDLSEEPDAKLSLEVMVRYPVRESDRVLVLFTFAFAI